MLEDPFESLFEGKKKRESHAQGRGAGRHGHARERAGDDACEDGRSWSGHGKHGPAKRKRWWQRLSEVFEFGD